MQTKICTKCNKEKIIVLFVKCSNRPDGLLNICLDCERARSRKRRLHSTQIKYQKEYYNTNKERILKKNKKWYEENYERARKNMKEHYKRNVEIYNKNTKDWRIKNQKRSKEIQRKSERKRRAIKFQVKENYTKEDEQYTKILFESNCANCGNINNLQIDHHQPLSKGNALTRKNAVLLCRSCNCIKHDKLPEEFYDKNKLIKIESLLNIV